MVTGDEVLNACAKPRLRRGCRLRTGESPQSLCLEDGEHTISLNETAAEILLRCDGHHSVDGLVAEIRALYVGDERTRIACAVQSFLELALSKGWIAVDGRGEREPTAG